jgi:hypothetical protein
LAAVEGDHAGDQGGQILRPGVDMIGQRHARLAVMLAYKPAIPAESRAL